MPQMTMSEALEKSGVAIGRSAAYTAAAVCLAKWDRLARLALPGFYERLTSVSAGLVEVVGETQIRVACLGYLERVAADMNNSASGGHFAGDIHPGPAPDSPKSGADGGQSSRDAQTGVASTAPQPIANGEGLSPSDARAPAARPVREPSKGQREAAKRVGDKLATSVLDTFKITERQGGRTAVGDLRAHGLGPMWKQRSKRVWVGAREVELIRILDSLIGKHAHVPQDALVRDVLSAQVVEGAIMESGKIADYQGRITSVILEIAHDR